MIWLLLALCWALWFAFGRSLVALHKSALKGESDRSLNLLLLTAALAFVGQMVGTIAVGLAS